MKNIILFILTTTIFGGCTFGTNRDKIQKTKDILSETRVEKAKNDDDKLRQVATLASGTDYSLKSVTNPPVQVLTAIDFNSRILSITGNPNIDELNKIKQITDLLNSEINNEREKGLKLLKSKDGEILELQNRQQQIQNTYESQIKGLESQAIQIAKKADQLQVTVDEVNSWMGLGGVVYGIKRFVTIGVTGILIFLVLFMTLRFFAASNPIASAIFSIFEHIAAFVINIIKGIVPKSMEFSKHIELPTFSKYKNTLDSIVDTVEQVKRVQRKAGKTITLDDILIELDKNLNDSEKMLIEELKSINKYGN